MKPVLKETQPQQPLVPDVTNNQLPPSIKKDQKLLAKQEIITNGVTKPKLNKAILEPVESKIHGTEVHVSVQKQVQKEQKGDVEITRKITAKETKQVEHKAETQEEFVTDDETEYDDNVEAPFFTKKIQPCQAYEGEQARFEVEFTGEPMPKITWYREKYPITSSPDMKIMLFGKKSILILRNVMLDDSAIFSVVAENAGGTAKCSANLVVQERRRSIQNGQVPPSFLSTIESVNTKPGQLVRFDVRVVGTRPLEVSWLQDGKKINPDIRHKIFEENNLYTLLIIEVIPEDSGKYECVATNSIGEARCEAQCKVESTKVEPQQPSLGGKPPQILEKLKGVVCKEGQRVEFKCRITAKPMPEVKWYKGENIIKPSKYFKMLKNNEWYTLIISEAFPEDEGEYKCIVSNAVGTATLTANLKVQAPIADGQDSIPKMTPMDDVVVNEGSPATFQTNITNKVQPTVQWLRDGKVVPNTPDFSVRRIFYELFLKKNLFSSFVNVCI